MKRLELLEKRAAKIAEGPQPAPNNARREMPPCPKCGAKQKYTCTNVFCLLEKVKVTQGYKYSLRNVRRLEKETAAHSAVA
jgi:hypothetical protein